jgi:hypothetical protein
MLNRALIRARERKAETLQRTGAPGMCNVVAHVIGRQVSSGSDGWRHPAEVRCWFMQA